MPNFLNLKEYRVTVRADGQLEPLTVYAAGKRQAGVQASKIARIMLDAKVIEIKRVVAVKHKPLA